MTPDQLYRHLLPIAKAVMSSTRRTPTLATEDLLQEYAMKFAASFDGTAAPTDRRALIRYAGFRMRQVLLDAVKRRQAEKRNYGMRPVEIGDGDVVLVDGDNRQANQAVDVERLDRAMGALESHDPEASTVINALFFGQMSRQEVAVVLGVDVATTENARARGKRFLREWLTASGTSDGFS